MGDYLKEYATSISDALHSMTVTDDTGAVLEKDHSLKTWLCKAKEVRDNRGTFFFAGNGASATMAEHMSHDCFQNADMLTYTCSETSHLTAIANDLSFEDVFSYRISKTLSGGDMLVAISSSGNSPNIIKAIQTAKGLGVFIVTVTGKSSGNKARALGDLNFHVPLETYGMVESAHSVLLHCLLDMFLDEYMGGRH